MSELQIDFKNVVEQSPDAIFITKAFPLEEPGPEIVYANKAYSRLNGHSVEEAIGKNSKLLQLLETDKNAALNIREALDNQQGTQVIYKKVDSSGQDSWFELTINPLNNNSGEVTHFVVIERDINEQKQLKQELEEFPKKDFLTGLFNRKAFDEILSREFSLFSRTRNEYSILVVDIDHFSSIENPHSRDIVLKELASTFGIIFRDYDLAARMGEDKFCILLRRTILEQAFVSGIRFRQYVQQRTIPVIAGALNVTVSVGVSQVLYSDTSHTDSQQRAEGAMKDAKLNGRDQVQLCKQEIAVINSTR